MCSMLTDRLAVWVMGQRQSGHKHDRKHTSYDKEQPSVISAAVSHCLCQYQTAVSYFCFFRFVKIERLGGNVVCCCKFAWKEDRGMWGWGSRKQPCQSLQTGQGAGCAGGQVLRRAVRQRSPQEEACRAWEQRGGLDSAREQREKQWEKQDMKWAHNWLM